MFPVPRRSPAFDLLTSVRRLNDLVDDAFAGWPRSGSGTVTSAWIPPTDVFEDKDSIRIVSEVPGLRPEDVRISLENQTLTICGERRESSEEKTGEVHLYERSYGSFERSFSLPSTVDTDRVQAKVADGLLTVTLPKVERAKPREIPVASAVK
jgi:HSP20 family protein